LTNAYNFTPPSTRSRLNAWLNTLKNASGQALRDAEVSPP
jgi:N-acetylglucosamine-6-sulfatase